MFGLNFCLFGKDLLVEADVDLEIRYELGEFYPISVLSSESLLEQVVAQAY